MTATSRPAVARARGVRHRPVAPWDPSAAHRFHTTDGTPLHVRINGPADADTTLVLTHGWTQDHTEWDPVVDALPSSLRVISYDHRGHGGSGPATEGTATVAQLADDLAELIGARAPHGDLVLAGHSMGGMTLMALAERHPELVADRVAGVAFVATSCDNMDKLSLGLPPSTARFVSTVDRALGRGLAGLGRDTIPLRPGIARPFVKWLAFGRRPARADVRAMTGQFLRAHPTSVAGFRDSMSAHDRRVALARLRRIPVVVLVGERDRITPVQHARVIATELPDAEFVLLPDAGHELTYERTSTVVTRLCRLAGEPVPPR
ncbi:alpha/beta hydrolase [Amycolatopsis antarctica]|uniref:Alpha/beta hydrolase n=1 Tax=Amycolatopsis antarctica TaxID=1854586 RepID=A0A263DAF2_9PSEU|nr:alpha/beta fold hydrolase [Amycolatopsis antarctica]OZM75149.1 alpha/beta hydrolase [Amycolatopsis antarctica]